MADTSAVQQNNNSECCCGPAAKDHIVYKPVPEIGRISTPAGEVPVISTGWSMQDYLGAMGVRVGYRRMEYAVSPGVYAAGDPGKDSPVLVSANYKLSFDVLRRALAGLNVWILVIDTKGINVWCAAGKGSFGTMEIAKRVMMTRLAEIVAVRKLIVPQLGAPGVSAHMVQAFSDFTVSYGPVRASDIRRYLDSGMKADDAMRRVTFGAGDRLAVAWFELTQAIKPGAAVVLAILAVSGITAGGYSLAAAWARSSALIGSLALGIFSGTVLTALLLPWLPGKAFSLKGGLLGAGIAAGISFIGHHSSAVPLILVTGAVSAYLALNFTGCSTYTSISGVKKEIRYALPAILGLLVFSGLLTLLGKV